MLTLTDEAKRKIKRRLNDYCVETVEIKCCEECIFNNGPCEFNIMEDAELLKCYHKWLDMINNEQLLGDEGGGL